MVFIDEARINRLCSNGISWCWIHDRKIFQPVLSNKQLNLVEVQWCFEIVFYECQIRSGCQYQKHIYVSWRLHVTFNQCRFSEIVLSTLFKVNSVLATVLLYDKWMWWEFWNMHELFALFGRSEVTTPQ